MHACTLHRCTSVRPCLLHRSALTCACSLYRHAHVHAYSTDRRGVTIVCALYPVTNAPMYTYSVGRSACVHAYYQIAHAREARTHKHPLYGPPYNPCQKNETLILCRMIRPLT